MQISFVWCDFLRIFSLYDSKTKTQNVKYETQSGVIEADIAHCYPFLEMLESFPSKKSNFDGCFEWTHTGKHRHVHAPDERREKKLYVVSFTSSY